jgi:branched-chain amino acid transport system permease protein
VLSVEQYPIQFWAIQSINGLVLGSVYALIALGYTLVYGILFMINFAHGEVVMLGGFAGYFTLQLCIRWGWVAADAPFLQSWMAVLFPIAMGMLASLLIAVALERIAYRPLRGAQRLIPLISAIGASFFLQYSALLIFGVTPHNYQKPAVLTGAVKLGESGVFVSKTGLFIILASIAMMLLLYVLVQKTKMGRAMRAVAEDREMASLMGVDVNRVIVITFVIGGLLAGAGGVMLGFQNTVMRFNTGFIPGLKAFTAAVLGGIGNVPGAMIGAIILGELEALGPSLLGLPNEYKDVIAFSVLIFVLIFRPTGILGERLSRTRA